MPFDYNDFQNKCNGMSTDQLQKEWENYTRQIAGASTSTAASVVLSPLTAGISLVGLGLSGPRIHNARKKREIIEAGLQARGATHNTRKRDVMAPMAISGAISGLTFGLAGPGADIIAGEAVGKGAEYVAAHVILDGAGAAIEHKHDGHLKKKGEQQVQLKMQQQMIQSQYMGQQQQYPQIQGMQQQQQPQLQGTQPQMIGYPPGPVPQQGYIQYQQQVTMQEQKYEYVPPPAAHSNVAQYQPASHQQHFTQPNPQGVPQQQYFQPNQQPQQNLQQQYAQPNQQFQHNQQQPPPQYQPPSQEPQFPQQPVRQQANTQQQQQQQQNLPQYQQFQQPEKYLVTVPSSQAGPIEQCYLPEKTPAYTSTTVEIEHHSSIRSVADLSTNPFLVPSQAPSEDVKVPVATQVYPADVESESPPAAPSMEEEILFLKMQLLQMQIEKRELVARKDSVAAPPEAQQIDEKQADKNLMVTVTELVEEPRVLADEVQEQPAATQQVATPALEQQQQQNDLPSPPILTTRASSPAPPAQQYAPTPAPHAQTYAQPTPINPNSQAQQCASPLPAISNPQIQQPAPSATPPTQQMQGYVPPPPPRSPNPQMQYVPPPPGSPNPQAQAQTFAPPPPSRTQSVSSTYQPNLHRQSISGYNPQQQQHYQPAPIAPQPQYQQQPPVQRQDSGYYSNAPTPMSRPQSVCGPISPQSTGQSQYFHGRNASQASLLSPMSPAPPPYFPPPPGTSVGLTGKDYFNQGPINPGYQPGYQPTVQNYAPQRQSTIGMQGWQWGAPPPIGVKGGEPNYGPPPPIPGQWKSQ